VARALLRVISEQPPVHTSALAVRNHNLLNGAAQRPDPDRTL